MRLGALYLGEAHYGGYYMDQLDKIIAYEQGELSMEATLELFQALVNSGLAWQLQGHYGCTAERLLRAGYLVPNDEGNFEIKRHD